MRILIKRNSYSKKQKRLADEQKWYCSLACKYSDTFPSSNYPMDLCPTEMSEALHCLYERLDHPIQQPIIFCDYLEFSFVDRKDNGNLIFALDWKYV